MIAEEKLNNLYDNIIEKFELTTKELNNIGFSSKDLSDLINQEVLVRIKRGLYGLKSVDNLFYYGKLLIAQKKFDEATKCFEACFQINPTHAGACFQLFFRCIQNNDFEKAFDYFRVFYENENKFYNTDNNFYLFLLNIITTIPDDYKEIVKNLKIDDIKVPYDDKRYVDFNLENKIRLSSFNQRFNLALNQLNESIAERGSRSLQDLVKISLLSKIISIKRENRGFILELIKDKKFDEIINFYQDMLKIHPLSVSEKYTLVLAKEYKYIVNYKRIPGVKINNTDNLFEAIYGNNFELALSLALTNSEDKNISSDTNPIYLLLKEIVDECKKIKENNEKKQNDIAAHNLKESNFTSNFAITFADIFNLLIKNDLDEALKLLNTYLQQIDKLQYEYLLVNLIKISLLEKDFSFAKPMTALSLISSDDYEFDIHSYTQDFYISLAQKKFEIAQIYLDIITKEKQNSNLTNNFTKVLEMAKNFYKRGIESKETTRPIDIEEGKNNEIVKVQNKAKSDFPNKEQLHEKKKKEIDFIDKKHEELLDKKGIILLKPMSDERIEEILNISEKYDDMLAFTIGEEKKQIVLKYRNLTEEFLDISGLVSASIKSYKEKDYDNCIEICLKLLHTLKFPREVIYSTLGLSYLRKKNIPLAIDYLTVATELSKKQNLSYDYSDLIMKIKGEVPEEDIKPQFKMSQSDFDYNDMNFYYGIENFQEINSYINKYDIDIDSACWQLGLTPEQTNIVKLIYVREFYRQGNFNDGDKLLKIVEASKSKTSQINKLIETIRKNKKFYQNRQNDDEKQIILKKINY